MYWYNITIKGKGSITVKAECSSLAIVEAEDRLGVSIDEEEVSCERLEEYEPRKVYKNEKTPSGWQTA